MMNEKSYREKNAVNRKMDDMSIGEKNSACPEDERKRNRK